MEDDKWTARDVFRIAAFLVVAGGIIFGIMVGIDYIGECVSRGWLFILAIPLAWWLIDDLRKERDADKKKKEDRLIERIADKIKSSNNQE